jgi:hypothetical protein
VPDLDRALSYLTFVEERHRAYEGRQHGRPQPWTDEPQVAHRKFTNVFRILDFGTQFILSDLVEPDLSDRDMLLRLFLYRHTGRVEAWQYLPLVVGEYPTWENLDDTLEAWYEYRGKTTTKKKAPRRPGQVGRGNGNQTSVSERPLFTGAYLVFPQSQVPGTDKIASIIDLTRRLFHPDSPTDCVPDFMAATTQADRFNALRRNKGVADFMSMQVLTDWGYTPNCGVDREDEFVVPGPGAVRGAQALSPGRPVMETLLWAVDALRSSEGCPALPLDHPGDPVRLPSWMDVQNTLCEFSKWVRFSEKPLPSKPYRPAHPGPQPAPLLPQHW